VPHLAWAGRVTLLAAPEKIGKSTVLGQAAAAMSTGADFLGEQTARAPVVWHRLDEPKSDLVRRLARFHARHGIAICEQPGLTIDDLDALVSETRASLVVIDTLLEYVGPEVPNVFDPRQWLTPLAGFRRLAQARNTAVVLLHHTVRDGTRYADSRQIGAGVDQIITMGAKTEDPTVRSLDSRGRVLVERLTLRYAADGYVRDTGEMPLELRIYRAIADEPGIGKTKLRDRVGGKATLVDNGVNDLLRKSAIEDRGNLEKHAYHVRGPINGPGPGQSSGQGYVAHG
jgi:hypothetical protein